MRREKEREWKKERNKEKDVKKDVKWSNIRVIKGKEKRKE